MNDFNAVFSKLPENFAKITAVVGVIYFFFLLIERVISNPRLFRRRKDKLSELIALAATAQLTSEPFRKAVQARVESLLFEEAFGFNAIGHQRDALFSLVTRSEGTITWERIRMVKKFLRYDGGEVHVQFSVLDRIDYCFNAMMMLFSFIAGVTMTWRLTHLPTLTGEVLVVGAVMYCVLAVMFFAPAWKSRPFSEAILLRFQIRSFASTTAETKAVECTAMPDADASNAQATSQRVPKSQVW